MDVQVPIPVNRASPRIEIVIAWGANQPPGQMLLYIRRAGLAAEFAVYSPLEIQGGRAIFQFDDLLFSHPYGRYEGRLVVGVTDVALLDIDYRDTAQILEARNTNVQASA